MTPSPVRRLLLSVGLLAAALWGAPAHAQLVVDVTRGFVEPLPIAVTDFYAGAPQEATTGKDIAAVVAGDLERSGLFRPIDQGAFIQNAASLRIAPKFADWRLINAQALISGAIELQADGRLRVEFRL